MFLGHYGIALAAKRAAPNVSLGTLAFSTQLLDELWPIFLLLGLEHAAIAPSGMAANPIAFVSYPISHSLLMAVAWGAVAALGYFALRRSRRSAMVVGLIVVSHWLLDVPMHRADLPLWPGSSVLLGFGVWRSIALTLLIDGGVFVAGVVMYVRSTTATNHVGTWGLWSMVAVLSGIYLASLFGPPPANERALALGALGLWLFVPWCAWIDRHREARQPGDQGTARRFRASYTAPQSAMFS